MTLASNDSGSLSSSSSRSSSRSAPSSGAVPSSWAIRASVALCSARAAAPSGGIFVSSSQLRSEEARARSEIAPRRCRRSSKRDRRSGTRAETSGLRGQVVGRERETEHDEEDRQQKQDQTADRNERSRARLAALLDVVQVLGFGLELLDRSRSSTERFSVEPSSVLPHLAQLAHHSSLSDLGAVVSSPGWTRTNNPPVNSRMLCQLSYWGRRASVYPLTRESTSCRKMGSCASARARRVASSPPRISSSTASNGRSSSVASTTKTFRGSGSAPHAAWKPTRLRHAKVGHTGSTQTWRDAGSRSWATTIATS